MVDVVFDNMKVETRPDVTGGGINLLIFRILLIFIRPCFCNGRLVSCRIPAGLLAASPYF